MAQIADVRNTSNAAAAQPLWSRWLARTHGRLVHGRRVQALAAAIAPLIEPGSAALDVGCGDGAVGRRLLESVPGLSLVGLDVLVRTGLPFPVQAFDGQRLPHPDGAVDYVLLVDVLHHTTDPRTLLAEAARVARRAVILKDHRLSRPFARLTLRWMDWVGNRAHGVALPYNYWSLEEWRAAWRDLNLQPTHFQTDLGLYPLPARWLFETGLHFLARLERQR